MTNNSFAAEWPTFSSKPLWFWRILARRRFPRFRTLLIGGGYNVCRRRRIESGGCKHPTHSHSSHSTIARPPIAAEWPPNRRIEKNHSDSPTPPDAMLTSVHDDRERQKTDVNRRAPAWLKERQ